MDLNSIFFLTLFFIFFLIIFKKLNIFVDNTNYSDHKKIGIENFKPIVIGGFYITLVVCIFFPKEFNFLKIVTIFVFLLGLLSDRNFLPSPKYRIILQVIILSLLVFFEQLSISSININFIDQLFQNNIFNLIFTVFCLSILLNGSNFLDGLNGLVTGYYLIILSSLIFLNNFHLDFFIININEINLIEILFFSLIIFFIFNLIGLVYLGDSGAYILGLLVGFILIKMNQQNVFISPYYVVNILWYPAFENLFSLIRRVYNKQSISVADKLHLHQLIYRFLKSKKIINKRIANPLSSLIILCFLVPGIFLSNLVYWHTANLIIILLFNIAIYLILFFLISKNFIHKK
jgi:UDP-N-acetylmuramyl pentapeptide phosphotransferase/UDP-N-acetylglucosamine-1-phosphate transferase